MSVQALKRYRQLFRIPPGGKLELGTGTELAILSIGYKREKGGDPAQGEERIHVRALVDIGAVVTLVRRPCSVCGAAPPWPDADGLWYLLENHDGNRLCFPQGEEEAHADPERDSWPVPGWTVVTHGRDGMDDLMCGECHAEMKAASDKVRAARRRKS